ncbi:MAG: substrate-binding domain-containing protein, partial [Marinomonas sp.]
ALFCSNDNSGMAAISSLTKHGFKVGKDVSVIGYDDIDIAEFTSPPMTSINIPLEAISRNACHQILNLCYGETHAIQNKFEPTLSIRESTHSIL